MHVGVQGGWSSVIESGGKRSGDLLLSVQLHLLIHTHTHTHTHMPSVPDEPLQDFVESISSFAAFPAGRLGLAFSGWLGHLHTGSWALSGNPKPSLDECRISREGLWERGRKGILARL